MKYLSLLLCFYVQQSFGVSNFALSGTYSIKEKEKAPIHFNLTWREDDGKISGIYRDDHFAQNADVTGYGTELGRSFTVILPSTSNSVRSIVILASGAKRDSALTLPLAIITRDSYGNPLSTTDIKAALIKSPLGVLQAQEEPCVENFGQLEGFCGFYSGMITEDQDIHSRCDLLSSDAVRLEVGLQGELRLHLGRSSNIIQTPQHFIGRLPIDPKNTAVDVMSRNCRQLPGINFPSEDCKRVNLVGSFQTERKKKHFKGGYYIVDEKTGEACKYGLAMDLESLIR